MKSIVDLFSCKLRVLEEDIRDCLVSGIIESLDTKAVVSTSWFS